MKSQSSGSNRLLSIASTHSSDTVRVPEPSSELLSAQYSLAAMQGGADALNDVFNKMSQAMETGVFSGSENIMQDINDLRTKLQDQELRQSDGMHEIELIMKDLMETQVLAELRKQVDEELDHDLDRLVAKEVKECLKNTVPENLKKDIEGKILELEKAGKNLHNSESRRSNALLRERNQNDPLHTIYKTDGTISDRFPKTLKELFEIDAKSCRALVEEYEIPNPADSRDGNLNRFLVFCGIQYQMVRSGHTTKRVGVEVAGRSRAASR